MLVWAAFGVAAFAFARVLFGERFAHAAAVAAGAPERAGGSTNRTARFSRSVGAALRAKERRVVWRDPWLKSQLLLQAAVRRPAPTRRDACFAAHSISHLATRVPRSVSLVYCFKQGIYAVPSRSPRPRSGATRTTYAWACCTAISGLPSIAQIFGKMRNPGLLALRGWSRGMRAWQPHTGASGARTTSRRTCSILTELRHARGRRL